MYKITFSYWDRYFHFDCGLSRFECGFLGFLKKTKQGLKTQIAIHRYSIDDGSGQIGRHVWSKTYNGGYFPPIDWSRITVRKVEFAEKLFGRLKCDECGESMIRDKKAYAYVPIWRCPKCLYALMHDL